MKMSVRKVRALMAYHGFRQSDLAKHYGVSHQRVHQLLRDNCPRHAPEFIASCAEFLKVSQKELLLED